MHRGIEVVQVQPVDFTACVRAQVGIHTCVCLFASVLLVIVHVSKLMVSTEQDGYGLALWQQLHSFIRH